MALAVPVCELRQARLLGRGWRRRRERPEGGGEQEDAGGLTGRCEVHGSTVSPLLLSQRLDEINPRGCSAVTRAARAPPWRTSSSFATGSLAPGRLVLGYVGADHAFRASGGNLVQRRPPMGVWGWVQGLTPLRKVQPS